jgi:hypothetical protein
MLMFGLAKPIGGEVVRNNLCRVSLSSLFIYFKKELILEFANLSACYSTCSNLTIDDIQDIKLIKVQYMYYPALDKGPSPTDTAPIVLSTGLDFLVFLNIIIIL